MEEGYKYYCNDDFVFFVESEDDAVDGTYRVTPFDGSDPFTIEAKGRDAWALNRLIAAGRKGCTPIEQPAPRWSAYVHRLRELNLPIETVWESHGGPYAGKHGRYVLRADVQKGGAV